MSSIFIEVKKLNKEMGAITFENETELATYHNIRKNLDSLGKEYQAYLTLPKHIVPFLQPGRMVKVSALSRYQKLAVKPSR